MVHNDDERENSSLQQYSNENIAALTRTVSKTFRRLLGSKKLPVPKKVLVKGIDQFSTLVDIRKSIVDVQNVESSENARKEVTTNSKNSDRKLSLSSMKRTLTRYSWSIASASPGFAKSTIIGMVVFGANEELKETTSATFAAQPSAVVSFGAVSGACGGVAFHIW